MQQPVIWVIDDDPHFRNLLTVLLESHDYRVAGAASPEELVDRGAPPAATIILDWQLGDRDGLELLAPLRERAPGVPVILSTAHSSTEVAVKAIRAGAFDFLPKTIDEARLVTTIASAVSQQRLVSRLEGLERETGQGFEGMLGHSPPMRAVFSTIESVGPTDAAVLITGESGTGKELVARAIHRRSGRQGAFVALNMAAIPTELVESTLFGHEKGAFSGAERRHLGAVEQAQGGTLFLDEIGEMPLELQAKLLRFLQEQVIRRVGGTTEVPVDVRIVSATNRHPEGAVAKGLLRSDLFYRLNVVPIALPALRERRGDVALLATNAVRSAAQRFGKEFDSIAPGALAKLEAYQWPGNVRELIHAMERLVIVNRGHSIEEHMLPPEWSSPTAAPAPAAGPAGTATSLRPAALPAADSHLGLAALAGLATSPDEVIPLEEIERRAIEHALEANRGNRNNAARALGISPATIYRKIKAFGLGKQTAAAS